MKKICRLIALLLLLTMCFAACGTDAGTGENTAPSSDTVPNQNQDPAPTGPSDDGSGNLILFSNGQTEYNLIKSKNSVPSTTNVIFEFTTDLMDKTGVDMVYHTYTDDQAATAKELIIGNVTGREESVAELAKTSYTGYRISIVGEKIVVSAYSYSHLQKALTKLLLAIQQDAAGNWVLPKSFTAEVVGTSYVQAEIPKFQTAGIMDGIYYCGSKNYEMSYVDTTLAEYQAYLNTLETAGFTKHAENAIGNNLFGTYVKAESGDKETMVHVMYHPSSESVKIIYGPKTYLPSTTPVDASSYNTVVTPSISQMGLGMVYSGNGNNWASGTTVGGAPGMSYVIQLPDASFVIIDGGSPDGTVVPMKKVGDTWERQEAVQTTDVKNLYDFLCDNTPGDAKPVIAAWIITHAHGDHIGLPSSFLGAYKDQIELRMAAYNFPDTGSWGSGISDLYGTIRSFLNTIEVYYPDAIHWNVHTGQKLYLPGCEIEIFATVEDYYASGKQLSDGNDTSCSFRVTLGDTTFMVLGDTYATNCEFMANTYGTALKSDILQMTHHGFDTGNPTGVKKLYTFVDPDICFWPCDDWRFEADTRINGTGAYIFNKWIKDDTVNETTGTRPRTHYVANVTTTIPC